MAEEERDQPRPCLLCPTSEQGPEIVGYSLSGQHLKTAFLALITHHVPTEDTDDALP